MLSNHTLIAAIRGAGATEGFVFENCYSEKRMNYRRIKLIMADMPCTAWQRFRVRNLVKKMLSESIGVAMCSCRWQRSEPVYKAPCWYLEICLPYRPRSPHGTTTVPKRFLYVLDVYARQRQEYTREYTRTCFNSLKGTMLRSIKEIAENLPAKTKRVTMKCGKTERTITIKF